MHSWIKLTAWLVLFEAIGFFLGLMTQANMYPWYANLDKSSLTPPGFVFSIVWPLLYAMLALVASRLPIQDKKHSKTISYLFAAQMLMNWGWTPLFFQFHWLTFSAIWLILLTCINIILIIKAIRMQEKTLLLLVPYVVWLAFASYLNVVIALMN